MYLYFNKLEGFDQILSFLGSFRYVIDRFLKDYEGCPYIEMPDDPEILYASKELEKFFFKATMQSFPQYLRPRKFGVYKLGQATAELIPAANAPYCLRLESKDWAGIADMKTLRDRLWAGTISPSVSYEKEQEVWTISYHIAEAFHMLVLYLKNWKTAMDKLVADL